MVLIHDVRPDVPHRGVRFEVVGVGCGDELERGPRGNGRESFSSRSLLALLWVTIAGRHDA
jgi:hypothetical protein